MTLEDIPVLCKVASDALHKGDTSAARLGDFQRRRRRRVAYAHRVSEVWALSMTSMLPGFRLMRDFNFRRLAKNPEKVETFVRELSSPEPVSLGTRLGVLIP